jgi:2-C-methyl-D-erythritol 4-phosphate cytidylyltransferase
MSSPSFSVVLFTAAPPTFSPETGTPAGAVKVDGREALLRSVELFLNRDPIKQVLLCFTSEFAEEGKRKFGGHLAFGGVKLLTAGPRWIDQCAGALEKLSTETTHILVHDAARPAVAYDDIDALLEAAPKHAIACLSAVQRNALFELDESGAPVAVHPARQFAQMLLPMSFSRAAFEQLAKSKQDPHASQIALVKGSHLNVRVSGGHDAALVGAMLKMLPKAKVKPPSSPFEEAQW